jgi:hypothetical protein
VFIPSKIINKNYKEILKYHKEKFPGVKLVKVTTTRWYEIPVCTSTPAGEIVKEWFKESPIHKSHAFRDGSLLIEYFNDDAKIEEI